MSARVCVCISEYKYIYIPTHGDAATHTRASFCVPTRFPI